MSSSNNKPLAKWPIATGSIGPRKVIDTPSKKALKTLKGKGYSAKAGYFKPQPGVYNLIEQATSGGAHLQTHIPNPASGKPPTKLLAEDGPIVGVTDAVAKPTSTKSKMETLAKNMEDVVEAVKTEGGARIKMNDNMRQCMGTVDSILEEWQLYDEAGFKSNNIAAQMKSDIGSYMSAVVERGEVQQYILNDIKKSAMMNVLNTDDDDGSGNEMGHHQKSRPTGRSPTKYRSVLSDVRKGGVIFDGTEDRDQEDEDEEEIGVMHGHDLIEALRSKIIEARYNLNSCPRVDGLKNERQRKQVEEIEAITEFSQDSLKTALAFTRVLAKDMHQYMTFQAEINKRRGAKGYGFESKDILSPRTVLADLNISEHMMGRSSTPTESAKTLTLPSSMRQPAPKGPSMALVLMDVQDAAGIWLRCEEAMKIALKQYIDLTRTMIVEMGGYEVWVEGDSFMMAFPTAENAVNFCCKLQIKLVRLDWPEELSTCAACKRIEDPLSGFVYFNGLRSRMGVHMGAARRERNSVTKRWEYFGPMVATTGRVSSLARGGDIVCTEEVHRELEKEMYFDKTGVAHEPVGQKKLKGLPMSIYLYRVMPSSLSKRLTSLAEFTDDLVVMQEQANSAEKWNPQFSQLSANFVAGARQKLEWMKYTVETLEKLNPKSSPTLVDGELALVAVGIHGAVDLWKCDSILMHKVLIRFTQIADEIAATVNAFRFQSQADTLIYATEDLTSAINMATMIQDKVLHYPKWPETLRVVIKDLDRHCREDETLFGPLRVKVAVQYGHCQRVDNVVQNTSVFQGAALTRVLALKEFTPGGQVYTTNFVVDRLDKSRLEPDTVMSYIKQMEIPGLGETMALYTIQKQAWENRTKKLGIEAFSAQPIKELHVYWDETRVQINDQIECMQTTWRVLQEDQKSVYQIYANPAPMGTVAIVFSDIHNTAYLWESDAKGMIKAITIHNNVIRSRIEKMSGFEVRCEGDAFMLTFTSDIKALQYCLEIQELMLSADWPKSILDIPECQEVLDPDGRCIWRGPRVAMGVAVGEPYCQVNSQTKRMDYFGPIVNKAARVAGISQGGQITITENIVNSIKISSKELDYPIVTLIGVKNLQGVPEPVTLHYILSQNLRSRLFPKPELTSSAKRDIAMGEISMYVLEQDGLKVMDEFEDLWSESEKEFAEEDLQPVEDPEPEKISASIDKVTNALLRVNKRRELKIRAMRKQIKDIRTPLPTLKVVKVHERRMKRSCKENKNFMKMLCKAGIDFQAFLTKDDMQRKEFTKYKLKLSRELSDAEDQIKAQLDEIVRAREIISENEELKAKINRLEDELANAKIKGEVAQEALKSARTHSMSVAKSQGSNLSVELAVPSLGTQSSDVTFDPNVVPVGLCEECTSKFQSGDIVFPNSARMQVSIVDDDSSTQASPESSVVSSPVKSPKRSGANTPKSTLELARTTSIDLMRTTNEPNEHSHKEEGVIPNPDDEADNEMSEPEGPKSPTSPEGTKKTGATKRKDAKFKKASHAISFATSEHKRKSPNLKLPQADPSLGSEDGGNRISLKPKGMGDVVQDFVKQNRGWQKDALTGRFVWTGKLLKRRADLHNVRVRPSEQETIQDLCSRIISLMSISSGKALSNTTWLGSHAAKHQSLVAVVCDQMGWFGMEELDWLEHKICILREIGRVQECSLMAAHDDPRIYPQGHKEPKTHIQMRYPKKSVTKAFAEALYTRLLTDVHDAKFKEMEKIYQERIRLLASKPSGAAEAQTATRAEIAREMADVQDELSMLRDECAALSEGNERLETEKESLMTQLGTTNEMAREFENNSYECANAMLLMHKYIRTFCTLMRAYFNSFDPNSVGKIMVEDEFMAHWVRFQLHLADQSDLASKVVNAWTRKTTMLDHEDVVRDLDFKKKMKEQAELAIEDDELEESAKEDPVLFSSSSLGHLSKYFLFIKNAMRRMGVNRHDSSSSLRSLSPIGGRKSALKASSQVGSPAVSLPTSPIDGSGGLKLPLLSPKGW